MKTHREQLSEIAFGRGILGYDLEHAKRLTPGTEETIRRNLPTMKPRLRRYAERLLESKGKFRV